MADSDNSRTLSRVTQGGLQSFDVESFPTNPALAARLTRRLDIQIDDLAVLIWHQWFAAWHRLIESCLRQQGLEQKLPATVGSPSDASAFTNRCDCRIRAGHRES